MQIKTLEIRDRGTFIPCIAIALGYRDEAERYLLRRSGYADEQLTKLDVLTLNRGDHPDPYVVLVKLVEVEAHYDAFDWRNQRTMGVAHRYIIEHWNSVQSGDVVDVEYILGESTMAKMPERLSHPMV